MTAAMVTHPLESKSVTSSGYLVAIATRDTFSGTIHPVNRDLPECHGFRLDESKSVTYRQVTGAKNVSMGSGKKLQDVRKSA